MKPQSRYRYERRIEELERENTELRCVNNSYRSAVLDIFDAIASNVAQQQSTNVGWILKQLRRCFK